MSTGNANSTFNGKDFVTAAAAGLAAMALTGVSDRVLDRLVSKKQKRRDRRVRRGTAHEVAGPYFVGKMLHRRLTEKEKKGARAAFGLTYSFVWGTVYAILRRKYPKVSRAGGLPFAIPFFFTCDGVLAPLLGVSPNLKKVPWQPNAKEMANHVVWTAAAEMVHRAVGR